MNINIKKSILEVYGLVRIFFGIGQAVGVGSSVFLLEFIFNYEKYARVLVVDEKLTALFTLVAISRVGFHIMAGVGIVRVRMWAKTLLMVGWPLMALISFGLSYHMYSRLLVDGLAVSFFDVVSPLKFLLYVAFIIFDFVVILSFLNDVDDNIHLSSDLKRFPASSVWGFIIAITLFFIVLMFLGRSMRAGYYPGFYKYSYKSSASGKQHDYLKSKTLKGEAAPIKKSLKDTKIAPDQKSGVVVERAEIGQQKFDIAQVEGKSDRQRSVRTIKKDKTKSKIPFENLVGFTGGMIVLSGFLFQFIYMMERDTNELSKFVCFLLCLGFFVTAVYGVLVKVPVISMTNFTISLFAAIVLIKCLKY